MTTLQSIVRVHCNVHDGNVGVTRPEENHDAHWITATAILIESEKCLSFMISDPDGQTVSRLLDPRMTELVQGVNDARPRPILAGIEKKHLFERWTTVLRDFRRKNKVHETMKSRGA